MSSLSPVAVLGLGAMGGGMADSLLRAGAAVTVYNRSLEKAKAFEAKGARVAKSPREAAANTDVVISMLADDPAAREVWLGENGALKGMRKGAIAIESSTISPEWARELGSLVAERGSEFLDAPVTGSKPQAAAGQLLFLVGGAASALERARPVLAAMSRDIVHLGPVGSGATVKLINNFMCGVQVVALAEAMALVERTDLDTKKVLDVLTSGAAASPLVKTVSARMASRDFAPNFFLKLVIKDLKYAIDLARTKRIPLASAEAAVGVMEQAVRAGLGDKDLSAVVELLRNAS